MPMRPERYCVALGCRTRVPRGRCALHAQQQEQHRPNVEDRRLYQTSRWRQLRARVIHEQPWCPECWAADQRIVASTDVHHRQKHHGDPDRFFDPALLEALCHSHHSAHTGRGE